MNLIGFLRFGNYSAGTPRYSDDVYRVGVYREAVEL